MSIATDIEVNWYGTVDNTNKIGLSDTLDQLGANVFDDADYLVGYTNKALKITKETNGVPHSNEPSDDAPWYLSGGTGYSLNTNNNPDGVYYRTILFAVPNDWYFGFTDSIRSNNSQLRIVTKLDLSKNKVYLTTTETEKSQLTISPNIKVNESIENTTADGTFYIGEDIYYLTAADIYLTDNGYYVKFPWLIDHMYRNFNPTYGEGAYYCANYDIDSSYNYSVTCQWFANLDWIIAAGVGNYYNIETWNNTELDVVPDADNEDIKFYASFILYGSYYWHCSVSYSVEYAILMCACYGMYFEWNGTPLKPVIENGEVKGYTDDMTVPSDIDNWTDISGHNISPTPPVPPTPIPSDDDYESMTTGFASTLSGCTKYYLMSPLDIVTLIRDYYTHAFAGSTLSNSIISCYLCGLSPAEFISTDTPAPIKIPTVAGETIFESVNSYKAIAAIVNKISVGNILVPRMNNDFHDFSPYTIYEVFIPYCGWISLPDTVAGKHIYVEFHVDVRTMAGKAIVLIGADDGGKATCAEMSMNFGASTPFAVIEAGLERQAAVTAGIQTAIGTAAAITGINSGHNALIVSSIGTAAQGIANGMMSSMANYTQVQGKAGDTSDFANGRQCYLKISWAKTDEVVNNSSFGHTVGYLCNTVGKIKDFKGLTVCANPHVTGIDCTESEKEEIKRLLEEGIIVN